MTVSDAMNPIFVGDIRGHQQEVSAKHLPSLTDRYDADFVVANGENAAGGNGLTPSSLANSYSSGRCSNFRKPYGTKKKFFQVWILIRGFGL